MTPAEGTRRSLAVGAGTGVALLLLEVAEAQLAIGGATALVNLVPVALGFVLGGPVAAGLATGVAVVGTAALVDTAFAVAVAARHALPGVALGMAVSRRLALPQSLLLVGAVSLGGLLLLVSLHVAPGAGVAARLEREVDTHIADLERLPERLGMSGDPWMADSARLATATLRVAAPGLILVGLFLVALTNYLGVRLLLRGQGFRSFVEEAVPDHFVWGVIGAGAMIASQHATLRRVGLNVLLALAPLYAVQGLAVLRHFFQKARLPRPLQGVGFGLLLVQPLLLIAVACLGLSDLWADFRKIRRAPTPA